MPRIRFDKVRRIYRLLDPSEGDIADADGFLRMALSGEHVNEA